MVLTKDQIAVIKNDFEEKHWSAYRIWKAHPTYKCSKQAVKNLVKKIKKLEAVSVLKVVGDLRLRQ